MANHFQTHEKLIQIIEQNRKSKLIKTGIANMADVINLMELQYECEDGVNYNIGEL